ncbi:unnamed protein product [Haemonchus placei]|uniref:Secreted peptide n=1 Tax=Haemonchus placei TaxID=6290 RepID=A0A0N4W855_HAEPC|nr:unnamed protein product [Haemonchus placei]
MAARSSTVVAVEIVVVVVVVVVIVLVAVVVVAVVGRTVAAAVAEVVPNVAILQTVAAARLPLVVDSTVELSAADSTGTVRTHL